MLRLKKSQANLEELIDYSLLVFGYVVIYDFFSETDDLFKRLKSKHLRDLYLDNRGENNNYTGGAVKTYIDLLGIIDKNKNHHNSIKKLNYEIELTELVRLPLLYKTANRFFNSNNLNIDVFQTLDTPNSKHTAQDPHFDRIPTLKFMLYINNVCIDLSHTKLACNFLEIDFLEILPSLLNCSRHLHMADADSENGGGLQIDKGSINFLSVLNMFKERVENEKVKKISWIPEIWQEHENQGKGFKTALNHLCHYI